VAGLDRWKGCVETGRRRLVHFAIDQVVNLELVKPVCLFQLPGAGSADDDLRFVFLNDRMVTMRMNSCAFTGIRFSPASLE